MRENFLPEAKALESTRIAGGFPFGSYTLHSCPNQAEAYLQKNAGRVT